MNPVLASGVTPSPQAANPREKLAEAAKHFEAIFVRQMLAEARKSHVGGDLLGGQAMDTFRQMQDERFADIAAERGAFGLAKMIEAQLAVQLAPLPPAGGVGGGPVALAKTSPGGALTSPPLAPPASGRGAQARLPLARGS